MRLAAATASRLAPGVSRYGYDRADQAVGIVHFGIGAFQRAHLAWYTDRALNAGERDWLITGVSLRSPAVAAQLNPQDGLYTVNERTPAGMRSRLVGAVREVLVAPAARARVIISLAAPQTRIVSFTVTEKGYCRAADGSLDLAPARAHGFYPLLAEAMAQRRAAGAGGLTLLPCDNLAANGAQLARLVREYLDACAPGLVSWFDAECTCPATMVDRIVPATTDADRRAVAAAIGLEDHAAVMTEPYSQWVIEDRFAGPRPDWGGAGAQIVAAVEPFETAKLRMLNGAHSLLAYCGLARGYRHVHEAIADAELRRLAQRLMLAEAAPTIAAAPGQDLDAYARALIERFANGALNHRLIQIAMDGSQKLPQRWLETLEINRRAGRSCPAILAGLRAWLRHLQGANGPVDDPLAERLAAAVRGASPAQAAAALFGPDGPFARWWQPSAADLAAIAKTEVQA